MSLRSTSPWKTTLPVSIAAIIGMAIAHFFWQHLSG
ncbi:hypothetical protein ACNKHS_03935 [Shigella flexneri]